MDVFDSFHCQVSCGLGGDVIVSDSMNKSESGDDENEEKDIELLWFSAVTLVGDDGGDLCRMSMNSTAAMGCAVSNHPLG